MRCATTEGTHTLKIASDYYEKGLGKSLGFLVGALVLGTAFPHLLKELKGELSWEFVLIITSMLASLGGILMVTLVSNGSWFDCFDEKKHNSQTTINIH